jgi:fatty-acyl-CoA synthase
MELIRKTIGECLEERARLSGRRPAVEGAGFRCTFEQLDQFSDFLAVRMSTYGIGKGTHVGIWSANSPQWVLTFLALEKIGAIPVLINTSYQEEEVKRTLNYADVEILYYGSGYKTTLYKDLLARIKEETPKVRRSIPMDSGEAGIWFRDGGFLSAVCSPEDLMKLETKKREIKPEDPACMIFTSGTTSFAKGVLLSHYSLVNNSRAMVRAMHWKDDDKMCLTVPMFHCFGVTAGILPCLLSGAEMKVLPYFKTADVWNTLEQKHCTILSGVPSMFLAMVRKPEHMCRCADSLRSGIIAGSAVTQEEYAEICGRFPRMRLQPSYGQTETSPCVTIADWEAPLKGKGASAGKVIDHVSARIAEIGTGRVLGPGRDGEIQVKGYNVMLGYYKLPEVTADAFTSDGWLRTGDIGNFDESGALHVTGRLKEMIIRGGENISPKEIEKVIKKLSWVEQVKVVGVPAEVLQEEIAACIVPKPGCAVDREGLLEFLRPRLARYKVPAYILKFDAFPMNASGKIELKSLKSQAAAMAQKERDESGRSAMELKIRQQMKNRECFCASRQKE